MFVQVTGDISNLISQRETLRKAVLYAADGQSEARLARHFGIQCRIVEAFQGGGKLVYVNFESGEIKVG